MTEPTDEDRRAAEYWGLTPEYVAAMPRHAADCVLVTTHHLTCTCSVGYSGWRDPSEDADDE